jgi:hypothetical protein
MEAICSSKMSVDSQRTTQRYIPKNDILEIQVPPPSIIMYKSIITEKLARKIIVTTFNFCVHFLQRTERSNSYCVSLLYVLLTNKLEE